LKNIDDKKPNKTESVHTIFTFQIEKGSDKELVIEEFSEAIGKYFSLFD